MSLMVKRAFDLLITVPLLAVLSPVLALVTLLIWFDSGSPVLFRQLRGGLHGRVFAALKFRTMTDRRDSLGALLPDEQRLTRLGALLRRASLDELPQLINVLRGEMSLVGPRPLLAAYLQRYSPSQMRRHETRPGLTGFAQVHGRNALSWPERFELDVWYVDHRNLWLDLQILWLTLRQVVSGAGVTPDGQTTMIEFFPDSPAPELHTGAKASQG